MWKERKSAVGVRKWLEKLFQRKEQLQSIKPLTEEEIKQKLLSGRNTYRLFNELNKRLKSRGIKLKYECAKGASCWVDGDLWMLIEGE